MTIVVDCGIRRSEQTITNDTWKTYQILNFMTLHLLFFYVYQQLPVYVLLMSSCTGQLSLSPSLSLSLSLWNIHPSLVYSSSLNKHNVCSSFQSLLYTFNIVQKIYPKYVDPVTGATWTKYAPWHMLLSLI